MKFFCPAMLTLGFVALLGIEASSAVLPVRSDGFRLTLVDGSVVNSSSIMIDETGDVAGTSDQGAVGIDDLVMIEPVRVENSAQIADAGSIELVFVAGGTVALHKPTLVDGWLSFGSVSDLGSVPVEAVRAIVWEPSDVVTQLVKNPPTDNDAVIVWQGDQLRGVEGVVEKITEQHVQLRFKGKSRKIGLGKVAGVVMADLQLPVPENKAKVSISLVGGGKIEGYLNRWEDGRIAIAVGGDVSMRVPVSSLMRMVIKNERLIYLSDLDPVTAQRRALFTTERPWRRDRSVGGNRLTLFDPETLQKKKFSKGIGTHSWSSLVFANDRNLDRFIATVGIDAETGGRGACRMVVRGDGIELWSGRVSGASGAQVIDVSVSDIQLVELEVIPGKDFDLADHANWCEARFVKTK